MSPWLMTELTRSPISWITNVVALFVIGLANLAASRGESIQPGTFLGESPVYQATQIPTPTPTPTPGLPSTYPSVQVTLNDLGYSEQVLVSPWGVTQYSFKLPDNWLVEPGGYFDLDFSYFYTELGRAQDVPELSFFGELLVYIGDQLLQVYSLDTTEIEHVHLRIDLPPDLFNKQPGAYHTIYLYLDASFLCNVPHKAQLIIHPESVLYLSYSSLPLSLDLGDYPRPFYQRSFDPDRVCFVLPAEPSETELHGAIGIAAELGKLTNNNIVISTIKDADWLGLVATGQVEPEHLFVIGRPGRNELIPWLNANTTLPVPIRRREMALNMEGPVAVAPGDVFTYTITVTNTTSASFSSLSVLDMLPRQTQLVNCSQSCVESSNGTVHWTPISLSPGEAAILSLALRLTDTVQGSILENTVVLNSDEAQAPLNVNTMITTIAPTRRGEMQTVASTNRDDYFFVQNGQAVPEEDGVLQEIISPWDPGKAILLITGASDQAVYKASQALTLEAHFPGMKGPTALVREIRPRPPITETLATDFTLADLGQSNRVIYGIYSQEVTYWFYVPPGWRLTNDAYFELYFSHSKAIDYQNSTLTILLNQSPVADVTLDASNADEGILKVKLPDSRINHGTSNRLSIRVQMQLEEEEECDRVDAKQVWLTISQDSLFHLDHRVQGDIALDLDYFPFPFNGQPDLNDVLFVIPSAPGAAEQEGVLRLAAVLGDAANGAGFRPAVSLGNVLDDETLSRYHIIAIGRASVNPLIQKVNAWLPQPFVAGTDEVETQVGEVFFRLPKGISLGYIQEIPSPWNEHRAFLAVTGTTDEGVAWAVRALTGQLARRLRGNLALVREGGEEVQSIDTRTLTSSGVASVVATAVPEFTPVATITSTPESETSGNTLLTPVPSSTGPMEDRSRKPVWLIPFVVIAMIVVLAMLGVGAWQFRRQQG